MQVIYLSWDDSLNAKIENGNIYSIETHPVLLDSSNELLRVYLEHQPRALIQFNKLKSNINIIISAYPNLKISEDPELNDLLVEVEWIVEEPVHDKPDYLQAQLQSYIRLISARLAFCILNHNESFRWLDVRDIVVTDEVWTQASIDVDVSRNRLQKLAPNLAYITTHGIGSSSDNQNTLTENLKCWDTLV